MKKLYLVLIIVIILIVSLIAWIIVSNNQNSKEVNYYSGLETEDFNDSQHYSTNILDNTTKEREYFNGKPIYHQGESREDLPEGEPFVLAIPLNNTDNYREKELQKKQEVLNNLEAYYTPPTPTSQEELDEIKKHDEELQRKEQEVLNVLYKYYEKNEIDNLIKNIEDSNNKNNEYYFSSYSEELLDKSLLIIENPNSEENEKTILKNFLSIIDLTMLQNNNLISRITALGIDLKSTVTYNY